MDAPVHRAEDKEFLRMQTTYGRTGGLASGADVAHRLRHHHVEQPLSTLARWIVGRDIVCIEWHGHILVPMFQFDRSSMTILPSVRAVLSELVDVFDDWEIACWFAMPNAWLRWQVPVDAVSTSTDSVVAAARADRCVAKG